MMTSQPGTHDILNANNKTPKTTTPHQNDKAKEEEEERSEEHMETISFTTQLQATTTQPHNTQRVNNKHQETIRVTMVQKNTRPPTNDDRIHELIQELSELKNRRWDMVTINET